MYKSILKISALIAIFLMFWQCTPDNDNVIEPIIDPVIPVTTDPLYSIRLWCLPADTFTVTDSASVLKIYANVFKDSLIASDSALVKFYIPSGTGSITEKSFLSEGEAVATYSAFIDSNTIYTGKLDVLGSISLGGKLTFDTLSIYIKDGMNNKKWNHNVH